MSTLRYPPHWNMSSLRLLFLENSQKNSYFQEQTALKFAYGSIVKKPNYTQTPTLIETYKKYTVVQPDDLIINGLNLNYDFVTQRVGLVKDNGIITSAYISMRPRDKVNARYYCYLLKSFDSRKIFNGMGTGIRLTLSFKGMQSTQLPVPSQYEQDQIVRYLDWQASKTNKLISALKKQIALLQEQKKAVINSAVTKGLDLSVPMKDSGIAWIGEIPVHWSIIKLRSILKPVSVKNHPELPLLSVVRELGVIIRDVEDAESNHNFIPDDLSNYKVVREGQFAMNKMKAWQGSYGISPYTGIVSPAYFVFDVNFPNSDYFHYAIRSKVYVNFFAKSSDGIRVGQWDLNMQKMKEIPFIVPPASEQNEIVAYIPNANVKIEKAIEAISQEIALLTEYLTRLISDVVTGQVDVRDIEVPEFEYVADVADLMSDDENTDAEETVDEEE